MTPRATAADLQQLLPEFELVTRVPKKNALVQYFTPVSDVHVPDPHAWMHSCDFQLASLADARAYLAPALADGREVAVDCETSSLNRYDPAFRLAGVSLSVAPWTGRYIPVGHLQDAALNQPLSGVRSLLEGLAARCPLVFHHAGFDLPVLTVTTGWAHPGWADPATGPLWHDTLLLSALANPLAYRHNLKYIAATWLGTRLRSFAETTGDSTNICELSPAQVAVYACGDAEVTLRFFHTDRFAAWRDHQIYRLERCVTPVVADAQDTGIGLDREALAAVLVQVNETTLAALDADLYTLFKAAPFDLNSPDAVGKALFEAGVPLTVTTKTGQLATDKIALAPFRQHPLVVALHHNRERHKFYSTYVLPIKRFAEGAPPAAPCRFQIRQIGAPTGRMAGGAREEEGRELKDDDSGCIPTNIQSWPSPDRAGDRPNLRRVLCEPDLDWGILACDYSQIELRLAANLSQEPRWIAAYREGRDLHQDTADTLKIPRSSAKTINFAVLYGAGAMTIASRLGMDVEDAQDMLDRFFEAMPILSGYIQSVKTKVRNDHQIHTALGRIRPFPIFGKPEATTREQFAAEREAVNTTVQGAAADAFKCGLGRLRHALHLHGLTAVARPALFVHDEVDVRVHRASLPLILPVVLGAMEQKATARWPVPLLIEAELGQSWGETEPVDLTPYRKGT